MDKSEKEARLALWDVLKDATTNGLWRGNPYIFQSVRTAIKTLNNGLGHYNNQYDLPKREEIERA